MGLGRGTREEGSNWHLRLHVLQLYGKENSQRQTDDSLALSLQQAFLLCWSAVREHLSTPRSLFPALSISRPSPTKCKGAWERGRVKHPPLSSLLYFFSRLHCTFFWPVPRPMAAWDGLTIALRAGREKILSQYSYNIWRMLLHGLKFKLNL